MLEFSKISSQGINLDKSDWVSVKFDEVAIKQNKKVDRETTELTRYVKGEHMGSQNLHLRKWGELKDEYLGPAFTRKFEAGDILYGSRRTYLRKVVIAPFEGITSNTTFVIKANEERIDKRLLPFVMMSEGFTEHSIKNSKGSVNPYINWKDIANYKFLLPPRNMQARLAELFHSAQKSLEHSIVLKQKLTASVSAYISTLRVMCDTERKVAETDILVIDGDRGKNYPKSQDFMTEVEGHCIFLNAKNVTKTGLDLTNLQFISEEKDSSLRKGKLDRNDIIVTTRGTVGNFAYYSTLVPYEHIRINSGMVILRNTSSQIDTRLLYLSLIHI